MWIGKALFNCASYIQKSLLKQIGQTNSWPNCDRLWFVFCEKAHVLFSIQIKISDTNVNQIFLYQS